MSYRDEVVKKIKEIIVPVLREKGFKGSYPHFRRLNDENGYDVLSFQFNKYGGSFLIEISVAYPYREEYKNCYFVGLKPFEEEVKKINHGNTFARHRIKNRKDEWFTYNKWDIERVVKRALRHLLRDMSWFDDPPIYEELEERKAMGLRY